MSASRRTRPGQAARSAGQSLYEKIRDVLITGVIVLLPVVLTVYLLSLAISFLQRLIDPVMRTLSYYGVIRDIRDVIVYRGLARIGIYDDPFVFFSELIAIFLLVALVIAAGVLAKSSYGERLIDLFDYLITRIPAVGVIYRTFRRMSDVMLQSGVENFREVKLVEFPHDDVYVLGFVTNNSPPSVMGAIGVDGMRTLFLPLAPNPVMGGFLTYIPEDRLIDVDMQVQEAVQLIVTSGIATEKPDEGEFRHLTREEREELGVPGAGGKLADEEDATGSSEKV